MKPSWKCSAYYRLKRIEENIIYSAEKTIILRVAENFIHTGSVSDEQVKVVALSQDKTSYVEHTGEDGRMVMLNEYRVDGKVIWAGYSSRSGTVYLSAKSG